MYTYALIGHVSTTEKPEPLEGQPVGKVPNVSD